MIFSKNNLVLFLTAATVATGVNGHMEMIKPCPRFNANGIDCPELPPGEVRDYNENAPISSAGKKLQPFCKYPTPWPTPAALWTAGEQVNIQFNTWGSPHSGGHCEWSVSYDGGNSFVVVHRVLQHCFYDSDNKLQTMFNFTLPADLPGSDTAVFAWTWVNAMGNREFYMNCADVKIQGSSPSFTGPKMTILNYPDYPTVPEFEGNYTIGLEYYENAPSITVYAPYSTQGQSQSQSQSQNDDPPPMSSSPPALF
ncbi:hypothetical protein LPJ64_005605 [Coemansia asiatica]|uniref:Lytic polysaccharide monooxygenase n=1 Tax=Coemansia asiatica TaxID=1052880 RepID=A0A9W8CHX3_9FUNG|nr:hypothetical protein LPJ64_005605 [Coemansia asiatica]KAJ2863178.1 hypothetical protein FB639_005312 [Coemansia asiatica]